MQNKSTCLAYKFNLLKLNANSKVKPEESGCNFCTTFFESGGPEEIRTLYLVWDSRMDCIDRSKSFWDDQHNMDDQARAII